ncbi:hypothetical protein [Cognatilysobacter bugurensis]|nr:hypothetical protein [Lysobacter bugurensis]
MKTLTLCALIALSMSMTSCSERDVEPVDAAAPQASAPAVDTAPAATNEPVAVPMHTGACEGLTGQALTDCLNHAGPTSAPPTTTDPATTEPSLTNPTPNDGAASSDAALPTADDADTPPQP